MVIAVMIATFEALLVFLLFLPGFISQRIYECLTPRKTRSNLRRIIGALMLSLLVYGIYLGITETTSALPQLPVVLELAEEAAASSDDLTVLEEAAQMLDSVRVSAPGVLVLVGIAVLLGLVMGHGIEHGWIYWLLRAEYLNPNPAKRPGLWKALRPLRWLFGVTYATGRDSVWEDCLRRQKTPLIAVHLATGETIIGRCKYSSDRAGTQELLVIPSENPSFINHPDFKEVVVIGSDGKSIKRHQQGVLVPSSAEIRLIEFLGEDRVDW